MFVVCAVLGARLIWLYLVPAWNSIVTDFPNYYVSAWTVRNGESLSNLYDPVWFERQKHRAGIERPAALFNYFPPMNALIMWPLAHLSPMSAKRWWTAVNLAALFGVIGLTVKASGLGWLSSTAVALLGLDALGNNLTFGQFYIVLTFLMLAALLLTERFPGIAGIASAAGTVTKVFPVFLLVHFLIRRKYNALVWSSAAIIFLIAVGAIVMGWAPHRVYLEEVMGRSLRGEIQDPYNVRWNTLQALLRRALVREETLNPSPILDAPWLFFFLRPVVSVTVVAVTLFAILRARKQAVLLEYGAIIAMVSLITPSQASYHQFLFYPAIAGGIVQVKRTGSAFMLAGAFALICSNVMGATSGLDSGLAMILAFPRVYLVLMLWLFFLFAIDPQKPAFSRRLALAAGLGGVIFLVAAFVENRRWIADAADGATIVPSATHDTLEVYPRFENKKLVTSVLGADGFNNLPPEAEAPSQSPDGRWAAYATNTRGNWDIALRSNVTGEVRFLTTSSANDLMPAFSPDGKYVYFASDRHRGYRWTTIYSINVDAR